MKAFLFTITTLLASYSLACSMTPMGHSTAQAQSVMTALANDSAANMYELNSMTSSNNTFTVVLQNNNSTETRTYSVREKAKTNCGQFEATLTNKVSNPVYLDKCGIFGDADEVLTAFLEVASVKGTKVTTKWCLEGNPVDCSPTMDTYYDITSGSIESAKQQFSEWCAVQADQYRY